MEARFLAGAADLRQFPRHRHPEIAFAGRSNVGKSSLLNRLVGRRGLARVGKTPGRTQQVNFFAVGGEMVFADLPGYGFAKVSRSLKEGWQGLVESYLRSRRQLRGAVVIVDVRRGVEEDDRMLLEFLRAHDIPAVMAATKIDKLGRGERERCLRALGELALPGVRTVVGVSGKTGDGARDLWREIASMAGVE